MQQKSTSPNSGNGRRVTIQDIAEHAGVGRGTVSRVLNDHPYVSDEMREKVMASVAALNYRPNLTARQMRTQESHLIGFLANEVDTTPYAGDIIKGAYDAARENGYMVIVVSAGESVEYAEEAVQTLLQRSVDALIYAAMYHHAIDLPPGLDPAAAVVVNSYDATGRVTSVIPDEEQGGYDATRHLIEAGHRRIAFINVNDLTPGIPASHGRLAGYKRALSDYGLPYDPSLVLYGYGDSDDGYDHTRTLLARDPRPTAIFSGNDRMAMGAYDAIKEARLRIPEDIALVGYDNQLSVADALRPRLTTMQLPHYEMGAWAVRYLMGQLGAADDEPQVHRMPCPLVSRNSVAPPRDA